MKSFVTITGSFNPISKAHRILLEKAVDNVGAEFGLFVITNDRYLTKKNLVKSKIPTPFHLSEDIRKEMVNSLTLQNPKLRFGGHELGNENPSTVRTLISIHKKYKDYQLYYLIGADKLKQISHWKDVDKLFNNFSLIVYPRVGYDIPSIINNDSLLSSIKNNIVVLNQDDSTIGISSSLIKEKFFKGEDYSDLMDQGPKDVLSRFTPNDFPMPSNEEIFKATILYGGSFGGNTARMKVFKENKRLFEDKNWNTSLFGNKNDVLKNTKVYKKEFSLPEATTTYNTVFDCVNEDCIDVAEALINDGYNPCILNLASNKSPCGGYHKGSLAQEECLAYSSNLSVSLYQFGSMKYKHIRSYNIPNYSNVYPMDINYGGIYSKDITFFRNGLKDYYSLKEKPFKCPVVTVASLSNREMNDFTNGESIYFKEDGYLTNEGREIESNKIRTIFRIALDNKHDSIVLGAFGCGVYNLLPEEVSMLFKNILNEPEFKNRFKKVVFAIYEGRATRNKVVGSEGKFKPFYKLFK